MSGKRVTIVIAVSLFATGAALQAQHEHHEPPKPEPAAAREPADRNLFQSDMSLMTGMTPEDPEGGRAKPGWSLHWLGIARLSWNDQGGRSGDNVLESSNWNMVMAQRTIGPGRLTLMLMNSLEPATFADDGSPELFQTGESLDGRPLVDRQHPHDFFMNLSATYRLPLSSRSAAWLQIAPAGEPALGPTAFMHRASAGENPTAPLGHHWQDSTHITWNVATIGWGTGWLSLESSIFHGEEPDEDRWDIDGGKPDSASGRATLRFPSGWSAQVSHGYLHDPEALEPGNTHRTTASVHYGAAGDRPFAATLLWGRNDEDHGVTDAILLEAAYQMTASDQFYGRAERVEKDYRLLLFKGAEVSPAIETPEIAKISALTLGYVRSWAWKPDLNIGIGGDLTAYDFPSGLEVAYGDSPLSFHVFLRLRWGRPHGAGAGSHAGH